MSRQTEFINKIVPRAIVSMKKHGVLASITIAQAVLKSGWGRSSLASKYHNLFGIKAIGNWQGKAVNMKTGEYRNGSHVTEKYFF
ncbi:glucosaminidase domain-containing protein [Clostridium aestuarii]|uniref:Glucosaminidase domain-containing protein n=1 Tax=Clostridium aestuarii TaxID=338193 RepID=A0ABT4D1N0_9CLOT|nr:glucosaminidase domain-containing protein [Clostridium aestuarii]MCY6483953.1 glucosaminidase domain-containing protein [Clostridium aestuarii]